MQVRRFIVRSFFFILLLGIALNGLCWLFYRNPALAESLGVKPSWHRLLERIKVSEKGVRADTLYVGDSVAGQVFPYNEGNQLCTNAAILPLGNYMLIKNVLQGESQVKTVIYSVLPHMLDYPFYNAKLSNNIMKPFYTWKTASYMDNTVGEHLDAYPFLRLYALPIAKYAPIDEYETTLDSLETAVWEKKNKHRISSFNLHWLLKIDSLCKEHDVAFKMVASPIASSVVNESNDWKRMRMQIDSLGHPLLKSYLVNAVYLPDSLLRDHIHFDQNYIDKIRPRLKQAMLTGLPFDYKKE